MLNITDLSITDPLVPVHTVQEATEGLPGLYEKSHVLFSDSENNLGPSKLERSLRNPEKYDRSRKEEGKHGDSQYVEGQLFMWRIAVYIARSIYIAQEYQQPCKSQLFSSRRVIFESVDVFCFDMYLALVLTPISVVQVQKQSNDSLVWLVPIPVR